MLQGKNASREKSPIIGANIEDHVYPPGFEPRVDGVKPLSVGSYEEPLYHLNCTPLHIIAQQTTTARPRKIHINLLGTFVNPHHLEDVPDFSEEGKKEQTKQLVENWKQLKTEIRAMKEDTSMYGINAKELSLVPDLVLPSKFKVLDFEKFDGTRCLSAHITMLYRKMIGYVGDDQPLIHYFQESLIGSSIRWYNRLSMAHIKSYKDLAKAGLEHYKHVKDVRLNRIMLQSMGKKSNESFRQ
ncbi:uncharacterized protein LOC120173991 [Hibiscus syriacus]|uniref:uncharacterized protein LOC120173991 n=1 Tax=Hibiscus syriacus TaxID=106335 RepID=UPI0019216A31|nr:uncharacterized protein LOC120173991 [Hibiscus syriacus]